MTKFGTPIGAGPKSAIVTAGLVSVGTPSGRRSASGSVGRRWPEPSSSSPPWRRSPAPGLVDSTVPAPVPRPPEPLGPLTPPSGLTVPPASVVVVLVASSVVVLLSVDVDDGWVVVDGGWVVVDGASGRPPEPASTVSSAPEQSGSARSASPSPSSSAAFAHCVTAWTWSVTPVCTWSTPTTSPAPAEPAARQPPSTARPTMSRSFRVIPNALDRVTEVRNGPAQRPRRVSPPGPPTTYPLDQGVVTNGETVPDRGAFMRKFTRRASRL